MAITLIDVLNDPVGVADRLRARILAVGSVSVERRDDNVVVFRITFYPEGVLAREGFPVEEALVWVFADNRILAVPGSGGGRSWRHRNGFCGELCLWYEDDPEGLRWEWSLGLEDYVMIVHRHLSYEEVYRRTKAWPVEEAPHGTPLGRWPIRTEDMQRAAQRGET